MVTFDQLMQPLIIALNNLGGSGSIDEIYEEVVELEKFDEQTLAVLHNPEKSSQTEVGYRLAWARTYLKKAGYLENSSRGVWALTDKARQEREIDSREIVNFVRALDRKPEQANATTSTPELSSDDSPEEAMLWREKLLKEIMLQRRKDELELYKLFAGDSAFKDAWTQSMHRMVCR